MGYNSWRARLRITPLGSILIVIAVVVALSGITQTLTNLNVIENTDRIIYTQQNLLNNTNMTVITIDDMRELQADLNNITHILLQFQKLAIEDRHEEHTELITLLKAVNKTLSGGESQINSSAS